MKKQILRLSLMSIALMLFSVNTALAADGDVIFHETFDACNGAGGNDGTWSGLTGLDAYSHAGWTLNKVNVSDRCVELGTSSAKGEITTSGIAFESGKTYTLILRMGGWDTGTKNAKVKLSTGKVDSKDSQTYALTQGEFSTYAIKITGTVADATLYIGGNTNSKNRFFLDDIMIVEGEKVNVTIASSGWSSMATPVGLDFSGVSGLTAFVASSVSAGGVTLTSVDEAAGATGLLLKGTAGSTYSIPIKAAATTTGTNKLSAAYSATPADANKVYILKNGKLCLVDTGGSSVPAGKAYLLASEVPGGAHDLTFNFDEEGNVTGIKSIETTKKNNGVYYDLSGRSISNPTKGLYIVNGKKVIIK